MELRLAKTAHKAEDVPVGVDSHGDEPPRLSEKGHIQAGWDGGFERIFRSRAARDRKRRLARRLLQRRNLKAVPRQARPPGQEAPRPASSPAPDKPADPNAKQPTQAGPASPGQPTAGQTPVAEAGPAQSRVRHRPVNRRKTTIGLRCGVGSQRVRRRRTEMTRREDRRKESGRCLRRLRAIARRSE